MFKRFRSGYFQSLGIISILLLLLFVTWTATAAFVPLGDEFVVNTTRLQNQDYPLIASSNNTVVIVWQQDSGTTAGLIYGRRFNLEAEPLGSEFLISASGFRPEVAMNSIGSSEPINAESWAILGVSEWAMAR